MSNKKVRNDFIDNIAKEIYVENKQMEVAQKQVSKLDKGIDELADLLSESSNQLDDLLAQAEALLNNSGMSYEDITDDDIELGMSMIELTDEEKQAINQRVDEEYASLILNDNLSWEEYVQKIRTDATIYMDNLDHDPFNDLFTEAQKADLAKKIKDKYVMKKAHCDKYDYLIATFSGIVAGLVDSFFVGMPGITKEDMAKNSPLGAWSDKTVDNIVIKIANAVSYKSSKKNNTKITDVYSAIAFLENKYVVSYDQTFGKSASIVFDMGPSNHHIKSLAHSPDIVGLLFAIIDQFTNTAHFIDNGRLITMDSTTNTLKGTNLISKFFCAFVNWIGHAFSDVAGSKSSRKRGSLGRGSGIASPLFELFGMCSFGKMNYTTSKGTEQLSVADFSVKVFEKGYDARFAIAQSIPVIVNDVLVRFLWGLKQHFINKKDWSDCIPSGSQPELRRSLTISVGVLCAVDAIDAGFRTVRTVRTVSVSGKEDVIKALPGGKLMTFVLHLNFVAYKRLAFAGIQELRAHYKEHALDIDEMEKDLKRDWQDVYDDYGIMNI